LISEVSMAHQSNVILYLGRLVVDRNNEQNCSLKKHKMMFLVL
jgi:hypothetical protein